MHLAEVIQMALHQPLPAPKKYIETGWVQEEPAYPIMTAAAAGLLVASGIALWNRMRSERVSSGVAFAEEHLGNASASLLESNGRGSKVEQPGTIHTISD